MMDWIQTIATQDKSLEGVLAKRNMEKQLAQLADVARLSETKRQHGVDAGLEQQKIDEQGKYREAQQAATQAERDRMQQERDTDNKRAKFSATRASLKPGDRITDPNVAGLIGEFEGGDQLSADPNDPTAHIYRKHEFEQEQLKIKQAEELRAEQEKQRQHSQMLQDKADARADKADQRAQTREERVAKGAEAKQKAAEAALKDVPNSLRPAIKARAEEIINQNSSMWDMLPWHDAESNKADAWITAANEVKEKAQDHGLMPITGPATVAPPLAGNGPVKHYYDINGVEIIKK